MDLTPDPELLAKEEKGTYGHYASVERVLELDDGKVEWRMATTSSAGGRIPQFMTERSIASSIARVSRYPKMLLVRILTANIAI